MHLPLRKTVCCLAVSAAATLLALSVALRNPREPAVDVTFTGINISPEGETIASFEITNRSESEVRLGPLFMNGFYVDCQIARSRDRMLPPGIPKNVRIALWTEAAGDLDLYFHFARSFTFPEELVDSVAQIVGIAGIQFAGWDSAKHNRWVIHAQIPGAEASP